MLLVVVQRQSCASALPRGGKVRYSWGALAKENIFENPTKKNSHVKIVRRLTIFVQRVFCLVALAGGDAKIFDRVSKIVSRLTIFVWPFLFS